MTRINSVEEALESMKVYLIAPHGLANPIKGSLWCYISGSLIVPLVYYWLKKIMHEKNALYYLNRALVEPKKRYSLIKNMCLELIFAI